jgi:CHY zinc finger
MTRELEPSGDNPAVYLAYGSHRHLGNEQSGMDLGYEDAAPSIQASCDRRQSMSQDEQKQRRASIKAIMADSSLGPMEKRLSIQHLMDGRRTSVGHGPVPQPTASDHSLRTRRNSSHIVSDGASPNNSFASEMELDYGYVSRSSDGSESPKTVIAISRKRTMRMEQARPPCSHYVRQCTIVSPCCGAAFGCRICHDDCGPALPPPKCQGTTGNRSINRSSSMPSSFASTGQLVDTTHTINRFEIRQVICRQCYTQQSSKTYVFVSVSMRMRPRGCTGSLTLVFRSSLTTSTEIAA